MVDNQIRFFLLNLSALSLAIWVFLQLRDQHRLFNISYIILITHSVGIISLLSYLLTAKDDVIFNNMYQLYIYDHVFAIVLSVFIPIVSIFILSQLLQTKNFSAFDFLTRNKLPSPLMVKFTLFIATNTIIFNTFFLIGRSLPLLGYITTVVHATFTLFSFWIGYWNVRLKWVFYVVLFSILFDSGVSVLAGGRFILFAHLALLFIGYVVSVPRQKQRVLITAAVFLLPLIYSLVAVMGVVRDRIGRGEEVLLEEGRISSYISAFGDVLSGDSGLEDEDLSDLGQGRSINWPNFSVMALSPDVIPYVGFTNIQNEIDAIFTVSGVSSGTTREAIDESRRNQIEKGLGTGMANRYGYVVNESTSVEWSLLADTWSKGGPLFYFIFYSVLFFIFIVYESMVSYRDDFSRLVYTLVLVRVVMFVSSSLPFYFILRAVLLDTILAFLIINTFLFFDKRIRI